MRLLTIDGRAMSEAARVVAYAMDHPYRLGHPVPGDNPDYVAYLDSYRVVFTFTYDKHDNLFRHISISVPAKDKFPNPLAALTIASLFGFTGWDENRMTVNDIPGDWMVNPDRLQGCVVIAQPVKQ